jgi:lipopolysaccharide/colanic/teichoic acid biosynthesis glycosyltransferase
MIALTPADVARLFNWRKNLLDRLLAFCLLILLLPVMALVVLVVKLSSRGPAIYRQTRVGRGGELFTLYKFRTMPIDSEKNGPQWSLPGDPRISGVGQFLRRTHLDELPQLWNVLLGDMSLIGPRPERPEFVPKLAAAIPHYEARLAVRPGVTGLAQVQHPADIDLDSVREKLGYDLWYMQHRGAWLDCRILVATGLKLFGISFPWLQSLLQLPTRAVVAEFYQAHVEAPPVFASEIPASSREESFASTVFLQPQR